MVMLTGGRNEMAKRAIRCFQAQTYQPRCLLIYDTGSPHMQIPAYPNVKHIKATRNPNDKLGDLRNLANAECPPCDVILHLDDDDWSHPLRMGEQIEILLRAQEEGEMQACTTLAAVATGYNSMLFYDARPGSKTLGAWLYKGAPNYLVGSSLCYWRSAWRAKPFPSLNSGEDTKWQADMRRVAVLSAPMRDARGIALVPQMDMERPPGWDWGPRMVCAIHDSNTASYAVMRNAKWNRAEHWDGYCAEVMR
jgi:glycosyltransferase involved in cell wall biosynthesis